MLVIFSLLGHSVFVRADIIDSFEQYSAPIVTPREKEQTTPPKIPAVNIGKSPKTLSIGSKKNCKTFFRSKGIKGTRQNGVIELQKEVFIKRCALEIRSKKAYLYFDSKNEEVVKIRAIGDVSALDVEPTRGIALKAKGETLVYNQPTQILELVGKKGAPAKIDRNQNTFESKKIIYNIRTDTIESSNIEGVISVDD